MPYARGCYSILSQVTLLSHSTPLPFSLNQYKRTNIIMHGTCLSGLYPVPFTHNAHDYPHFNIYISFGGPKYCITALTVYTLCHLPITPMIIHILISISHSALPNIVYCITALNT
ncbi:CEI_1a_G0016250.mRNA.1.CDS.1 [Saccharomyces cerevisiae]|nr:CEI_1a_G0016250.mRNA.1.CDS.1 [Saccharomyces cerevisiae]CAI7269921.1 CEI_1a_G0016250.mRNA.1.CDS.1 [Saccharomyces cerevisiae]